MPVIDGFGWMGHMNGTENERWTVVLDINLIVAAYWNQSSASARIIRACLDGRLVPAFTDRMISGLWRILRNIRASQRYLDEIVEPLLELGREAEPMTAPVLSEDPEDQSFLECAAGADADYLITSDRHLLKLSYCGRAAILTPSEFVRRVGLV
jgi:putative PIN family toxin of toxin-antitoxin system